MIFVLSDAIMIFVIPAEAGIHYRSFVCGEYVIE